MVICSGGTMNKQDRINEIYKAALKVFGLYGFQKATVEDIAAELGLTKGALYQYVKDKRELYEKAVGYGMRQWQERVRKAIALENDVIKQFRIMCYKAFQYLSEDSDLKSVLIKDPNIFPLYFSKDPYQDINNDSINLLQEILKKGIQENKFRNVNVEYVSRLIFSIYKMFIVETYIWNEDSFKTMFDEMILLFMEGLYLH